MRLERKLHVLFIVCILHITVGVVLVEKAPERNGFILPAMLYEVADEGRHFQKLMQLRGGGYVYRKNQYGNQLFQSGAKLFMERG